MDAAEERARALCKADGIDPSSVNWMGDPDVPNGTMARERWREYEDEARRQLNEEESQHEQD